MKKISAQKMSEIDKLRGILGKDYSNFVENSVNEILYAMYRTSEKDEKYEEMINRIGTYVKNKLNIVEDEKINWQEIEDWYYEWGNSLTSYLSVSEIAKILGSIKIKDEFGWEEPYGKINVTELQNKIYNSIINNIDYLTKDELIKKFVE